MSKPVAQKIVPHLWYVREAEEAARFYATVFPDSRVDRVTTLPADSPSGPPGSVVVVEFTLCGQAFMAISAGEHHAFNDAVSFLVNCESQDEIDRYWEQLSADKSQEQCGWLKDKYGMSWQIVPAILDRLVTDPDPAKVDRVMAAVLKMRKLAIAELQRAHAG